MLEAAQAADIHQRVLFGRHGEHIAVAEHLVHDGRYRLAGVVRVALLDEPGVFGKACRVDDHRNTVAARQRGRLADAGHADRLATGAIAGHGDDQAGHVGRTVLFDQRSQARQVKVAFPVVGGGGVQRLRRQHVDGACAGNLYVRLGGVKVVVGQKHRLLAATALYQLGEQDLLGTAALVGRHGVGVAEYFFYRGLQLVKVTAAGVGFVAHHHAGPLAVRHGAGAAVGQQVDVHVFAAQQEGVPAGSSQCLAAVFRGGLFDGLYHLDAERFGNASCHVDAPCLRPTWLPRRRHRHAAWACGGGAAAHCGRGHSAQQRSVAGPQVSVDCLVWL